MPMPGSIAVGQKFLFSTVDVLGSEYAELKRPPYDGQIVTVVGFRPRLVNSVLVRYGKGDISVMPLEMAEKALSLQATQATDGHER